LEKNRFLSKSFTFFCERKVGTQNQIFKFFYRKILFVNLTLRYLRLINSNNYKNENKV